MPRYTVTAHVDQIVTRKFYVTVDARDKDEATELAREAVSVHPEPLESLKVNKVHVFKQKYWIPRDIEIKRVIEETKNA